MMHEAAVAGQETHGTEGNIRMVGAQVRLVVSMPARILDSSLRGKHGATMVHLTYFDKTGSIQINTPMIIEMRIAKRLADIEAYYANCGPEAGEASPNHCVELLAVLRHPPYSETLQGAEAGKPPAPSSLAFLPDSQAFRDSVQNTADTVDLEFQEFPSWRLKLLKFLEEEFGLAEGPSWLTMQQV